MTMHSLPYTGEHECIYPSHLCNEVFVISCHVASHRLGNYIINIPHRITDTWLHTLLVLGLGLFSME